MLVIAIGAILFMVFYAPYGFFSERAKLRTSVSRVEQVWSLARMEAMNGVVFSGSKNANIFLRFDVGSNSLPLYTVKWWNIPSFDTIPSQGTIIQKKRFETLEWKNIIKAIRTYDASGNESSVWSIGYFLEAQTASGKFVNSGWILEPNVKKVILTIGKPDGNVLQKDIQLISLHN